DIWDATIKKHKRISRYYDCGKNEKIPIYILQALSLLYNPVSSVKRSDILKIYSTLYSNEERDFTDDWEEITEFMESAFEKLENMKDGFGVKDEKSIPFQPTIPIVTALLKIIDGRKDQAKCYKKLKIWYWSAVFTNAYAGAVDTQLTIDFKEVKAWFDDDARKPKTVEKMRINLPSLNLMEIKKKGSAVYNGILSLVALEGAKDFETSQTLENARINEDHHIYPNKSILKGHKYLNSVLNKTWISKKTNIRISNKEPSIYLKDFVVSKYDGNKKEFLNILSSHFINEKAYDCLMQGNFEGFLKERERLVISKIKELIEYTEIKPTDSILLSPGEKFSSRMVIINALRECDEYIYWFDKYFTDQGLEYLCEVLKESDIKQVKIIQAIEKTDEKIRKAFKNFRDELATKGINCELRVLIEGKIKEQYHDRFIVSKYVAFNVMSTDSIARSQFGEISKSPNRDKYHSEFEKIWQVSKDIISHWGTIEAEIAKRVKKPVS
ncbi:MAG: hypothetical protein HY606_10015, partial [Planctomycetes bacterium]|nr:hypothetical protein [Planctomycetota bacterium]